MEGHRTTSPKIDKETTTLRIPVGIAADMRNEARNIGCSLNDYMLISIHFGRKVLNSNITFCPDTPE